MISFTKKSHFFLILPDLMHVFYLQHEKQFTVSKLDEVTICDDTNNFDDNFSVKNEMSDDDNVTLIEIR